MFIPCEIPLCWYQIVYPMTLTLTFDLLLKNFNLGHYFQTRCDKPVIFHMCIPCGKTFSVCTKYVDPLPSA